MKLQKAAIWVDQYFTADSKPDMRTVKKWVRSKVVRGVIIEKQLYIDVDAFNTASAKKEEFTPEPKNKFEFIDT